MKSFDIWTIMDGFLIDYRFGLIRKTNLFFLKNNI